jgi:hypothetical protein
LDLRVDQVETCIALAMSFRMVMAKTIDQLSAVELIAIDRD